MKEISFESQVLHTPFEKEDAYHSLSMPVYNTAAYEFDSAEAMEAAFADEHPTMHIHVLQIQQYSILKKRYAM